jgi:hypothetical protein
VKSLDKETKRETIFGLIAVIVTFTYAAWVAYSYEMIAVAQNFAVISLICVILLCLILLIGVKGK